MRVLLLEHDPLCALDYLSALEASGHVVHGPVARVAQARRLLRQKRVDLALIDIHLEFESGLDLLPIADRACVPCVAITGDPQAARQAEDRLLGCIPKPVTGGSVAELVDWIADARAGHATRPPNILMLFHAVPPPFAAPPRTSMIAHIHALQRLRRSIR